MTKSYFKGLMATAMLAAGTLFAGAADYISVNPVISPADGYKGGPKGIIYVTWPGVSLKLDSQDKDVKTPVDPSYFTITVNGNEYSGFGNGTTGSGRALVGAQELEGGQRLDDQLLIELPDMFFFWRGAVKVDIKEGAVSSTSGAINKPITLNYTFGEVNYNPVWDPAQEGQTPVSFVKGNAVFYLSWEGAEVESINNNANIFYQLENSENTGDQVPARQYVSVVDGRIKCDFSSFGPGTYIIGFAENSATLSDGSLSGEAIYNFKIVDSMVPQHYVSVLPNEYDWFDGFSVIWAENPAEPFVISSQYAEINADGDYIFNAEGLKLISVMENGTDPVAILSASIVESQVSEDSENYPNAQLNITLTDFQTNVGSLYSLKIGAGLLEIEKANGQKVANEDIIFSFTLKETQQFELPAPQTDPKEGTVESLESIVITWPGTLGGYDLINYLDENDITMTLDNEDFTDFEVTFAWSDRKDVVEGADGNEIVITFENGVADGTLAITIPAGFVNVTDVENGTYANDEIILYYTISSESNPGGDQPGDEPGDQPGGDEPGDNPSGVSTLEAEAAQSGVYNLNGVKVGNSLNGLNPGIYVVNGKKVVLK